MILKHDTFSHVSITGNRTPFASSMTDTAPWQTDQANSILQLRLAVKLQQRDIIVECLTVVIVVDVRRCDAQGLSAGASVFTSKIMIAHPHVDRIARPDNAANECFFTFWYLRFSRCEKILNMALEEFVSSISIHCIRKKKPYVMLSCCIHHFQQECDEYILLTS